MSAGWLAEVASIERVDVVELEPAIEHVARLCAPVNHDALEHPKVHVHYGDGREFLITSDRRYDVIVSEPSNPWRAGVASLFSQDFYRHAASRLSDDGIFGQWVQVYEIDAPTLRTLIATLTSVFPHVEIWATTDRDLLLTARLHAAPHDRAKIAERLGEEPQASALRRVWRLDGVEGFYAGYVAAAGFATRVLAQDADRIDTDADPVLEFGFSRGLGGPDPVDVAALRALSAELGLDRPELLGPPLDFAAVKEARLARDLAHHADIAAYPFAGYPRDADARQARIATRHAYRRGAYRQVRDWWFRQPEPPRHPIDLLMLTDALVRVGDARAGGYLERLEAWNATEAGVIRARGLAIQGDLPGAAQGLAEAFVAARQDPWPHRPVMSDALAFAVQLAEHEPALGKVLFAALEEPFSVQMLEAVRQRTRVDLAERADFPGLCVEAFAALEPHVPWEVEMLRRRARCYEGAEHPLLEQARRDLERIDPAAAKLGAGLERG
jgi:hypothetical protein